MTSFLRYLVKRIISLFITLLITTAVLYAIVMLTPAETRATLYMPKNFSPRMTEEQYQALLDRMIAKNHLNDPYPVQYYYWMGTLLNGNWGYSPTLQEDVLSGIARRAPATIELTLYSILIYFPLGILSGAIAGARRNKISDHGFRLTAFIATSLPPFILAIVMMVFFYIQLHWFMPGQISTATDLVLRSDQFHHYTQLLTIDALLNGRLDIAWEALRHIAMPAITLAFAHWATLGRITRATTIEELQQDYVTAARARGVSEPGILWRHTLRNSIGPGFSSSMVSAASLLTGVFVVEIIFNIPGISSIAVNSMAFTPDAPAALGFSIYSVFVVFILMSILDLIQYLFDPRLQAAV